MIILNGCILIIVLLLGFHFKDLFNDFKKSERQFLNYLFFFHIAIAVIFHFYINANGGDAMHYWNFPKESSLQEIISNIKRGSASSVIFLINYFFTKVLSLSFFVGNMIYAVIGFVGFVYFFRTMRTLLGGDAVRSDIKLFGIPILPWIWFLPNLHFWSSGIGKDTILFTSIALFIYGIQKIRGRIHLIVIALILSLAIRPHISLFLIIAFGFGFVLDGRLKAYQKVFILLVFSVGFISLFDYVLKFIQLESLETSVINEYTAKKASSLNQIQSGSGVNISGYPLPVKIFTFLYRPLFFDINGIFALIASFENLILIIYTYLIIKNRPLRAYRGSNFILKGLLFFVIIGAISFSLILGNLGIMLRQKNMFMPALIIIGLVVITQNRSSFYKSGNPTPPSDGP